VGEPVTELTATSDAEAPLSRVVVGTEAVLQRIDRADAVAFLDLDQELLAPRYRAAEQALALVARAARVVAASGPASGRAAGHLLLQTRSPDHEVVRAAVTADVSGVAEAERARRELLRFPPCSAMAEISGASAPAFVSALGHPEGIEVVEAAEGRWWVRAADHDGLCGALAQVTRPAGRLRIEVDPLRI
jgi:primosomal protein N' (replication factor Y)